MINLGFLVIYMENLTWYAYDMFCSVLRTLFYNFALICKTIYTDIVEFKIHFLNFLLLENGW